MRSGRLLCVGILLATAAIAPTEIDACGDKFLRMGRSARLRGYAAVHPASILIYTPATATPSSIKQFETLLKRAGHTPRAVPHDADLGLAIAASTYDVVIAAYADTQQVEALVRALPARPDVLPILHKPTADVAAAAAAAYHCRLQPETMTKHEALAEIDHLMERRLAARGSKPRSE